MASGRGLAALCAECLGPARRTAIWLQCEMVAAATGVAGPSTPPCRPSPAPDHHAGRPDLRHHPPPHRRTHGRGRRPDIRGGPPRLGVVLQQHAWRRQRLKSPNPASSLRPLGQQLLAKASVCRSNQRWLTGEFIRSAEQPPQKVNAERPLTISPPAPIPPGEGQYPVSGGRPASLLRGGARIGILVAGGSPRRMGHR